MFNRSKHLKDSNFPNLTIHAILLYALITTSIWTVIPMQFDPAITAHEAFKKADALQELGSDSTSAAESEEIFSASAGLEAKQAYQALLAIGIRHPKAQAFQAFLIFSTWQQATEETVAEHFQTGADLCQQYLSASYEAEADPFIQHIREIHQSFIAGLGQEADFDEQAILDYDNDSFAGGD